MKLQLEHETVADSSSDTPTRSPSECDLTVAQRSVGACRLYSLPPCMVKDLLHRTLRAGQSSGDTTSIDGSMGSLDVDRESIGE